MLALLLLFQTARTLHAVDVSNYSGQITYSQWLKALDPKAWHWKDGQEGLACAITSGLQGHSQLNLFAAEQMATARAAGVSTGGFCLISSEVPGDVQVKQGLSVFGEELKHLAFMAIDVEDPAIDPVDHKVHPELVISAIEAVKKAHLRVVIYTSRRIWKLTPWIDKNPFSGIALWDADYDDSDNLSASGSHAFLPYGGWTSRFCKQYNDESHGDGLSFVNATKIIGADVNVLAPNSFCSGGKSEILPCMYVLDTNPYKGDGWRTGPNILGGTAAQLKVELAGLTQPEGGIIKLRTDSPLLLQIPRSIPAKQTSLSFPTSVVDKPAVVTVYATYRGKTASTVFRLLPSAR